MWYVLLFLLLVFLLCYFDNQPKRAILKTIRERGQLQAVEMTVCPNCHAAFGTLDVEEGGNFGQGIQIQ